MRIQSPGIRCCGSIVIVVLLVVRSEIHRHYSNDLRIRPGETHTFRSKESLLDFVLDLRLAMGLESSLFSCRGCCRGSPPGWVLLLDGDAGAFVLEEATKVVVVVKI